MNEEKGTAIIKIFGGKDIEDGDPTLEWKVEKGKDEEAQRRAQRGEKPEKEKR